MTLDGSEDSAGLNSTRAESIGSPESAETTVLEMAPVGGRVTSTALTSAAIAEVAVDPAGSGTATVIDSGKPWLERREKRPSCKVT